MRELVMDELVSALHGTPVWVWAMLALVVFLGVRELRPSFTSLRRLAILPVAFLIWSVVSLFGGPGLSPLEIASLLGGWTVGGAIGFFLASRARVGFDREAGLLQFSGSAMPLTLYLLTFAVAYGFGYSFARWPELKLDAGLVAIKIGVSALISGIFVGRFAGFAWRFPQGATATA